jgi:hypothetical protein
MRAHSPALLFLLLLAPVVVQPQQKRTKDISAVYAEGKIGGSEYKNNYFGLTLVAAPGQFTEGGFVNPQGNRARLIDVQNNSTNYQDRFEIAVLADSLAANPKIHSPEQYARSVRHQFEKENMETREVESPVQISGLKFVHAILKAKDGANVYYRGVYTTFLNGYILSLDVSAATPGKIAQLVTKAIKFKTRP